MKTEYNKVLEIMNIFDQHMIPYTHQEYLTDNGLRIGKLIDGKSGDVYIERYNASFDCYNVYKFDKWNIPEVWDVEEDSDTTIQITQN